LIHNQKPQEEVDQKCNASYILRVEDCANKTYKNVNDIFIKWPIKIGFFLCNDIFCYFYIYHFIKKNYKKIVKKL